MAFAQVSLLYSSTQRTRPVIAALRQIGIDVDAWLRELGISEAQLLDPRSRVPRERAVAMSKGLAQLSPRSDLGVLAAELFELPDLGVVGYLLRHSEHPLAALQRLMRYSRLIADAADVRLQHERGEVVIHAGLCGERELTPLGVDFSVGTIVRTVELLSSGRARPLSVMLPRARPADMAAYRRLFGSVLSFGGTRAVLRYPLAVLRAPCPEYDPGLLEILEQHAEGLLVSLPAAAELLEQTRAVIGRHIGGGELSATAAASELRMSERSLRRKLASLGTSYRELLDDVRRERALALLGERKLGVSEIAQRVGFADATAFTRTFRRWTGSTPSTFTRVAARSDVG